MLQALACLRALGMGIEDMRTYQANRGPSRHARSPPSSATCCYGTPSASTAEIAALHTRLDYLREKAALWDARARGDAAAEAAAQQRVHAALDRMDMETEIKR